MIGITVSANNIFTLIRQNQLAILLSALGIIPAYQ